MIFNRFTEKSLLLFMAAASAAILAAAYTGQYGFDLHPCELCLYQRYPYMAIIVLALAGAYAAKSPAWRWNIGALCVLLFVADAGIAGYHAGVELKWFPGPSGCAAKSTAGMTLEEMRAAIMSAPLVSCDQAMAHVMGLSLAAWNAIVAVLLAVLSIAVLQRLRIKVPRHG